MYGSWFSLAALALAASVECHMIMLTPTPFNNETIDNSPLESSGSNFPCKTTGQSSFYNAAGIQNSMAVGETQTLSFRGSAVHGGGSCQLAITSDKAPTASSTWSVIQSIEGGCPSTDGTAPSTYNFQIPQGVAPGDYVFAWTWVSKLAGQPEYYMNCAPITVTGGSSKAKRSDKGITKRGTLPNLAVFNLASINSCKSTPGTDPTYADPGSDVVKPAGTRNYATIAGSNCFPSGGSSAGGASGSGGSSGGSASGAPAASSTAATAVATAVATAAAASSAPSGGSESGSGSGSDSGSGSGSESGSGAAAASSSSVVATPAGSGGVTAVATLSFPGVTPIGSTAAASPTAGADGSSGTTGSAGSSGSDGSGSSGSDGSGASGSDGSSGSSGSTGSAATTAASPASTPSSSSSSGSGSSAGGLTGACSNEGEWNCIGGSNFQRCASGSWSTTMAMPGGTTCTPGQSQDLWARMWERAVRRYRRRFVIEPAA